MTRRTPPNSEFRPLGEGTWHMELKPWFAWGRSSKEVALLSNSASGWGWVDGGLTQNDQLLG